MAPGKKKWAARRGTERAVNKDMKKKVLLIAYHFPPEASGGTARPYSLYKYLSRYDYGVLVITQNRYGRTGNEKNIFRFASLVGWRRDFTLVKFFYKVISKLKNVFGAVPEGDAYWRKNVLAGIDKIIAENSIGLVYATYPAGEALNLGIEISGKYRLPLVSEFNDGVMFEPIIRTALWQKPLKARFEEKVVSKSSAVITVGRRYADYFRQRYGREDVYTVYNGYDRDDFAFARNSGSAGPKRRIAHFGAIDASRRRDTSPLYRALKRLKKDGIIDERNFELSFIGRYTDEEKRAIHDLNLDDIIKIYAPMDRASGLARIAAEYDFLLLYGVPGQNAVIPGKLFEYLELGKPIIGICGDNESGEIIVRTGTGEVCDFDGEAIASLFRKFLSGDFTFVPDKKEIAKYDREFQAGRIAAILDRVIK